MSPNFASTLFGVFNTCAMISSIYAPSLAGVILQAGSDTRQQWNLIFYLAAFGYVIAGIVFVLFVRAEVEPWDKAAVKQQCGGIDDRIGINFGDQDKIVKSEKDYENR